MRYFLVIIFVITGCCSCKSILLSAYTRKMDKHNGEPFPRLALIDTAGNPASLERHVGKWVYIDMWFVGCGPCINEFKAAVSTKERFRSDTNLVFVNICFVPPASTDEWLKEIEKMHASGYNYYVTDSFYNANKDYLNNQLTDGAPTFHMLDPQGHFVGFNIVEPSNIPLADMMIHEVMQGRPAGKALKQITHKADKESLAWVNAHFVKDSLAQN